jgi:hypothetical protein
MAGSWGPGWQRWKCSRIAILNNWLQMHSGSWSFRPIRKIWNLCENTLEIRCKHTSSNLPEVSGTSKSKVFFCLFRNFLTFIFGRSEKVINFKHILHNRNANISQSGYSVRIVLAQVAQSHPPSPKVAPDSFLKVCQEQSAPSSRFQLSHKVEIHVIRSISSEKWFFC